MKKKNTTILLIVIFILTLSLRLYFSFQHDNFLDGSSYYSLRQVEHISSKGIPIFNDDLSYGGRTIIFPPFFYYLLSLFNLFLPISLVGKIVPNLFASLTIFPVYLISYDLTKDRKLALFASFVSTFIPIYFAQTVNSVTPYTIVIPMILFLLFLFIHINKEKKYQVAFLFILFLSLITHPITAIFVFGLIIFLIFMKLENMKINTTEVELTIFSSLFLLWFDFILYKKAFLLYGLSIFWYNIPSTILIRYFADIDILTIITVVGVIPFSYGVYIFYKYLFQQKNKNIYLILSYLLALGIMLWAKLIPVQVGLMFLGVFLILLICVYLKLFFEYLKKTRFHRFENLFILFLIIGFVTTSFIPTLQYTKMRLDQGINSGEIKAFEWAKTNLEDDAVILASPEEGHIINYIAGKKNVIDSNYLFIENIDMIFSDVKTIYTTKYETQAIDLLSKYGINYIFVSPRIMKYYGIKRLSYIDDHECFKEVYSDKDNIKIIKSTCYLEES